MKINKNSPNNVWGINETNAFEIFTGPGKFELITKSFSGKNKNRPEITFMIRGKRGPIKIGSHGTRKIIKVQITSLSWKNQSGDSWLFRGEDSKKRKVKGYYNTSTHSGYLDFEDNDEDDNKISIRESSINSVGHIF